MVLAQLCGDQAIPALGESCPSFVFCCVLHYNLASFLGCPGALLCPARRGRLVLKVLLRCPELQELTYSSMGPDQAGALAIVEVSAFGCP